MHTREKKHVIIASNIMKNSRQTHVYTKFTCYTIEKRTLRNNPIECIPMEFPHKKTNYFIEQTILLFKTYIYICSDGIVNVHYL